MKKQLPFTAAGLKSAGFVEFEQGKFGHKSRVTEMAKGVTKKSKKVTKQPKSKLKFDPFVILCSIELGLKPEPEHMFHQGRKWRMDYAFTEQKVFLEVEGGVWTGGRHTRGKGFINDMEKYNAAAAMGWTLIRCVPDDLMNGKAIKQLKDTLQL